MYKIKTVNDTKKKKKNEINTQIITSQFQPFNMRKYSK